MPWRPSGMRVVPRLGRPTVATRPSGVSIRPGATVLTRMPRRAPSIAAWRARPNCAALDASYAGNRLPGFSQRFGQRPDDISKPPGLRKQDAFGSDNDDAHSFS